ncbi:hypothetical protein HN371_11525 [Candidatus Poribacteria bacterium]|nr:hypothetical protein [Candidatus Poribacteria bacterium]MBT5713428.1 hypothetical protein [Candidatus Poribacteria bacterium]MBT7100458.1 hypothetical protein [Candidatus Poribacteria bacterium]
MHQPAPSVRKTGRRAVAVTPRAVVIGCVCVTAICLVEPYNDYEANNTWIAAHHFPIVAPFLFAFLILVVNVALESVRPSSGLSAPELITIWCMMIVTASLPTLGLAAYLIPTLLGPTYFASPENDWAQLFHHHIPSWLIPSDARAIDGFFRGLGPGQPIPWGAWIRPLGFWAAFTAALWAMMVCLSTIVRKQWVETEKFTFPLVQLPAELAQRPADGSRVAPFFNSRRMWIAFAFPVVIHTVSTLHFYYPVLPEFPLRISTWRTLATPPWSAVRPLDLNMQPSTIGLSYLMSLEVSFSLWAFYLIYKAERLLAAAMGYSQAVYGRGFVPYREMGAYVVLFAFFVWIARRHIGDIVRKARQSQSPIDDSTEPLSYRACVLGLAGSILAATVLILLAGADAFWLMLGVMAFFGVVCVVDAWLVTRGLFFIHGSFKAPDFFVAALGTARFGAANLTAIAFPKRTFFRDRRETLMPHVVNSFKLSDAGALNRRHLLVAMVIALALAVPLSFYAYLDVAYRNGAVNLGRDWIHTISPREPFNELERFLTSPTPTNWLGLLFVAVGGVVMLLLLTLRYQFIWWPLHPIGFITPGQFPMNNVWFSIFLGWLLKAVIVRQGGLKGYRAARPVFLGVVLGEACGAGVWAVIGLFTGQGYNVLYF